MTARYALYFAPLRGSLLARFGDAWLGRDVESGSTLTPPAARGFDPARHAALTEAPRHYGFHGTLKPPFHLADGSDAAELRAALAAFAARQAAFTIPQLALRQIGDFLALVPAQEVPALAALAEACVSEFDSFRAPPSAAELAKRQAAGLTARQSALLARWGYPYVMEEFRFHLTLTGPVPEAPERTRLAAALAPLVAPVLAEAVPVREICLFHQPDRAAAFRLTDRFAFAA